MDVVDLRSGDGSFTLQIAKIARQVTAINIAPNLLAAARRRLSESGVQNCKFISDDAHDATKFAEPADFIFFGECLSRRSRPRPIGESCAQRIKA